MEKHTIPEKNLKDDGSITFDQTKDQWVKITIMGKENKSFKQMDKLTEVDWGKFKRQPFPSKKEKQQSAVEWLIEKLTYDNGNGVRKPSWQEETDLTHFCDQAKELFKQQIEDAKQEQKQIDENLALEFGNFLLKEIWTNKLAGKKLDECFQIFQFERNK